MKKIFILAVMALAFGGAQADEQEQKQGQKQEATANSNSVAGSEAFNAGNSQSITFTSPEKTTVNQTVTQTVKGGTDSTVHQTFGTQTIKNTPSVSAAPLVSSNDTCMGSASGSVNGPGFGLALGKTYTDDNCVMLKNSRELWNMGMKAAALALMCQDSKNRDALHVTGFACPGYAAPRADGYAPNSAAAAVARGEPTDPIVRTRMGLPPIKE